MAENLNIGAFESPSTLSFVFLHRKIFILSEFSEFSLRKTIKQVKLPPPVPVLGTEAKNIRQHLRFLASLPPVHTFIYLKTTAISNPRPLIKI